MSSTPNDPASQTPFKGAVTQMQDARALQEQSRMKLLASQSQLKRIDAQLAVLAQVFDPNTPQHVDAQNRLASQQAQARAAVREAAAAYDENSKAAFAAHQRLTGPLDPRTHVGQLSDDYPFLLLPLRIETRFKQIEAAGGPRRQLWVRVFPDDCSIDTFEPLLSSAEVRDARRFWGEVWRAGGRDAGRRGAWRALVSSHRSGRAAWIVQHYVPVNLDDEPRDSADNDLILVIFTEDSLDDAEKPAVAAYWSAVWLADGDITTNTQALHELQASLGEARAQDIIDHFSPFNLDDKPTGSRARADMNVKVEQVVFPRAEDVATAPSSWTQAARVNVMPDRFVLMGYMGNELVVEAVGNAIPSPLAIGPDPSAPDDQQLRQVDGELQVGDDTKWLFDFERAVQMGMGFKIDLTEAQYTRGFDRLLVLGVRLASDEDNSRMLLEALIDHHHSSSKGFSLLQQGVPTNNTEEDGSGYSAVEDADDTFDLVFGSPPDPAPDLGDWLTRKDGQWLAEMLGIDSGPLSSMYGYNNTDQMEAKAMNIALWPATLGYSMDTMLRPVFDQRSIAQTHWFFTNFVSGRGMIPPVRIGSQPYGIFPTTVFSRMSWVGLKATPVADATYLSNLQAILLRMDRAWDDRLGQVSYLGKPGDPHQQLLDILGLQSGSVEFYQRYAESLDQWFNELNLEGLGAVLVEGLIALGLLEAGMGLLRENGYDGDTRPEILEKFFFETPTLVAGPDSGLPGRPGGPLVEIPPLSETDPLRACTSDGRNYIRWLLDAAGTSLETLRRAQGFTNGQPPNALLYLMLNHALTLGYWDASVRLYENAGLLTGAALQAARQEPKFIHVAGEVEASESRWQHLYQTAPEITGQPDKLVADFIRDSMGTIEQTHYLAEQLRALELMQDLPTARLERIFAEHIDCCTYRVDAWKLGLVQLRLASMRYEGLRKSGEMEIKRGLYLGSYGWLEDIRPSTATLTTPDLDDALGRVFNSHGEPSLRQDSSNGGYIHAPSVNHAVTAAIMRSGYLADASSANPDTLSVNLTSGRVRRALGVLEGIRNGQSLAALLGYQFERGLHDRHHVAGSDEMIFVDEFIYKLRKAFPLGSEHLDSTRTSADVPIEAIEARNVVDGLALVDYIKRVGNQHYPFGRSDLPAADHDQAEAINAEVDRLLDLNDSVADLALAESVHQMAQGNYGRAAATLDAYSNATFPPLPDVVQTPRSGIALTHRVALHLDPATPAADPLATTPRAVAEPAINAWLEGILPPPSSVSCHVTYFDVGAGSEVSVPVTQADLGLQPIDLLYVLDMESPPAMTSLDDMVIRYVVSHYSPRPDSPITIRYMGRVDETLPFFELGALVKGLRSLILRSRPLTAGDIMTPTRGNPNTRSAVFLDEGRIVPLIELLQRHIEDTSTGSGLQPFAGRLNSLLADVEVNRAAIISGIDGFTAEFVERLSAVALFGLPQTGFGFVFAWKLRQYAAVIQKIDDLVGRWQDRLAQYDVLLAEYGALPDDAIDQRLALLRRAEGLVSGSLTTPIPPLLDYLAIVTGQHDLFAEKLDAFRALLRTTDPSLSALMASVQAELPVSAFDLVSPDLSDIEDEIVRFTQDLQARLQALIGDLGHRLDAANAQLAASRATNQSETSVAALTQAAKTLLGDEFAIVPHFDVDPDKAAAWANALTAQDDLLAYLRSIGTAFPVDDWLYGVARVREKMRAWENITMLARAFGTTEPDLSPAQLPYKPGDSWLALSFPDDYTWDGDRLLYSAHYAVPFDGQPRQCGILLDEWSEVIPMQRDSVGAITPATQETTGLTFHYNQPNAEAPQVMLLVAPPAFTGHWEWTDLVDALHETLQMAKRRAVEPEHIDVTTYARFLPATISAVTAHPITIGLNLALTMASVREALSEAANG